MTEPDRARYAERSKLRRLADLADRIAGDVWQIEDDGLGTRIFVRRFDGPGHVVCEFTEHARSDDVTLVAQALDALTFFLPLVGRASARIRELGAEVERLQNEIRTLQQAPRKPPDYAAQASMLLVNAVFHRFLSEKREGEVVDDRDTADAALKALIGIESKKQLTTDDGARARWRDLHAEFSAFERMLT